MLTHLPSKLPSKLKTNKTASFLKKGAALLEIVKPNRLPLRLKTQGTAFLKSLKKAYWTIRPKDWELDCIYAKFPLKMDVRTYCKLMYDFSRLVEKGKKLSIELDTINRILHSNTKDKLKLINKETQRLLQFSACYEKLNPLLADFKNIMDERDQTDAGLKVDVDKMQESLAKVTEKIVTIQELQNIYTPMKKTFQKVIEFFEKDDMLFTKLTKYKASNHKQCASFESTFTDMTDYENRVAQFEYLKRDDPFYMHEFKDYFKRSIEVSHIDSDIGLHV